MTVVSGILGTVDGSSSVRRWLVQDKNETQQYASSNTQMAMGAFVGNDDWTAFYAAFGHTPVRKPGDTFTFKGTVDGTLGLTGSGMVDVVRIDWPTEEGQAISHVVGFSAMGAMTAQSGTIADTTTTLPPTAIATKIQVAGDSASPSFADITGEEREMHLTIRRKNRPYVSGRTAGQRKRLVGEWDGEVEFTAYAAKPSDLPQKKDVVAVRMFVNSTQYWEIRWFEIDNKTDEVHIEGTENYSAKLHGTFRAIGGGGVGKIVTPAGTTWWP